VDFSMKLIIQIPCFNEAEQLPETLAALPRAVPGFDTVEWLVIDDGSNDNTSLVAREHGVDHVVRLPVNKGLATAFQVGLDAALKLRADVIVNTDADGQYDPADIPALVEPIVEHRCDLVVGDRGVGTVADFSPLKRRLQRFGSRVVESASGMPIPDATSGFRAYSRDAALQLVVLTNFTYTLETLIQAGNLNLTTAFVPITRRTVERPSRLFKSNSHYIRRSVGTILRVHIFYRPIRFFATMAGILFLFAAIAWTPFLLSMLHGEGHGHVQSVVLGAVLMLAAIQLLGLGVVADLLGRQRMLSMKTLERVRRVELTVGAPPDTFIPSELSPLVDSQARTIEQIEL
jgi:glycosyltransferase involved in cell wall biosynthesis